MGPFISDRELVLGGLPENPSGSVILGELGLGFSFMSECERAEMDEFGTNQ